MNLSGSIQSTAPHRVVVWMLGYWLLQQGTNCRLGILEFGGAVERFYGILVVLSAEVIAIVIVESHFSIVCTLRRA